jgi:SAM-dependent methyltransferase
MKTEWFEKWFGKEYIALYPHRNVAEAEHVVALIEGIVGGKKIDRALDLACGAGRHSGILANHWWTVGLDLSEVLLQLAHRDAIPAAFVRGDMRVLPFADSAFDLVVNLFTSFGYFADDESHHKVVREVARVTRPGGTFVLDFLNTTQLRRTLVPYDEREIAGSVVEQRREISDDGRYVIKRICIRGTGKEFTERVRLFDKDDLSAMMIDAGFRIDAVYGNYDASPVTGDSPRVMLFGRRR